MANYDYKVLELTDNQLRNSEAQMKAQGAEGWLVIQVIRIKQDTNLLIATRRIG